MHVARYVCMLFFLSVYKRIHPFLGCVYAHTAAPLTPTAMNKHFYLPPVPLLDRHWILAAMLCFEDGGGGGSGAEVEFSGKSKEETKTDGTLHFNMIRQFFTHYGVWGRGI